MSIKRENIALRVETCEIRLQMGDLNRIHHSAGGVTRDMAEFVHPANWVVIWDICPILAKGQSTQLTLLTRIYCTARHFVHFLKRKKGKLQCVFDLTCYEKSLSHCHMHFMSLDNPLSYSLLAQASKIKNFGIPKFHWMSRVRNNKNYEFWIHGWWDIDSDPHYFDVRLFTAYLRF